MTVLQICMVAVTGVSAALILKQSKSDLLPLLRLSLVVLLAFSAISAASPLVSYIQTLSANSALAAKAPILLKALGIALLTQACSQSCKECGESGIATGVETFGKIQILILCLPILSELFLLAERLLEMGGDL